MNPIDTLFEVATPIQRKLLENVRYVPETECWEWTGKKHRGVHILNFNGIPQNAKNVMFKEFIGPLVEGDTVKATCGNGTCVSPSHITPVKVTPSGYWTKERCAEEALKYSVRGEFQKNNESAYTRARRNGWLDEICSHMTSLRAPVGYWTKERCAEEALKYSVRKRFQKGNETAYTKAHRNGWLDEICSHMTSLRAPVGYWTKERCAEEAQRFKTRIEFLNGAKAPYRIAYRHGWIDEICGHMQQRLTPIAA